VEAVTGATVEVIVGKPSPIILKVALARLGVAAAGQRHRRAASRPIIAAGKRLGLATVLVLTGVTRAVTRGSPESRRTSCYHRIRELIR